MSSLLAGPASLGDFGLIRSSLAGLWVRDIVDTLKVMRRDITSYGAIVASAEFRENSRLVAAASAVTGEFRDAAGLPDDQRIELAAMNDVGSWPDILTRTASGQQWHPPLAAPEQTPAGVSVADMRGDPRYIAAMYDAVARNRALARGHLLRTVKPRPQDHVPGGKIYVGPSHAADRPGGLDSPDNARKRVNEAIWHELGVGEGSQASVNTWDTARFSFGPGFAATGLLTRVMDNLAKAGASVTAVLRDAGVALVRGEWWAVDPATRSVKRGKEALEVLAADIGLINTFLDTADDPVMRKQWMDAEWQALTSGSGAAAVPQNVVDGWPIDLIVFVAHCVHWGGKTWTDWGRMSVPELSEVVRIQAGFVGRGLSVGPFRPGQQAAPDARVLTWLSAQTFFGFSGGLLGRTVLSGVKPQPLPADWREGHNGEVAVPATPKCDTFFIIGPTGPVTTVAPTTGLPPLQ